MWNLHFHSTSEEETYLVRLVDSPRELFYQIKQWNDHRSEGMKGSRVLAGKGRTNGEDWQWMDDHVPLNRRKTLGPFKNDNGNRYVWNLHNYTAPESFASDDGSVNLVGCLDTSQGLDFEYIGLILSSDIEYDSADHIVRVNLAGHQQGDPNLDMNHHQNEEDNLKTIVKNTYRVLASRGAKGCLIYCCDEALQQYLGTLIPVMNVEVPEDYNVYPDNDRNIDGAADEVNVLYVGNTGNRSFHLPDCRYAPRASYKRVEFASREAAVAAGYRSCPTCNA